MAQNVLKLKKEAVSLGMDKAEARTADRTTLEAYIAKASKGNSTVTKKKTGTVAKKKAPTKTSTTKTAPRKTTPKAKTAPKRTPKVVSGNGGRHMVGSLDFSITDGWNPRAGSAVATIFKTLKRYKGSVDKTVDDLLPNAVSEGYVSSKKRDGTKRVKSEITALLRYRVNRTKFEFARRTGQHVSSAERIAYGTGPYATTRKKVTTPKRTTKTAPKTAPKAKGRPRATAKK